MAKRRLKPGWMLLGAVVGLLGLWVGLPRVLRGLDFFRVRRVEIAGLHYLDPTKVLGALQLSTKASVFDHLRPLGRRVVALRGVTSATVGRKLPGTLVVSIHEVEPVALIPGERGLVPIDARARVLPFDPVASAPDLPVVAGADRVLAGALARVRDYEPELYARVAQAWRVGPDVVLEVEGRRLWLGPQISAEDLRALMAVERSLARQGHGYRELDGRFTGQVIVRGRRA